jgi:hemolysin III
MPFDTPAPPTTPSDAQHAMPEKPRVKPRLRGVSHRYAFLVALLPCFYLVWKAPSGRATVASAIYVGSLLGMLATSALFHEVHWSPRARFWIGRHDLLMIFVLIAGSYTPIAMLRLEPDLGSTVLIGIWTTVLFGGALKTIWAAPPKWVSAAIFVSVASVALLFLPDVIEGIGTTATALLLLGGLFYTMGATAYGLQWPDPFPETFGYHEIFHAFVIAGAAVHFGAIARYVVLGAPG